jgi:hypothetical protein
VECIARAKALQLNLTDTVKTVPFRGETERITKMMWPPALQQHPGASLRFLFLGETDRITKWCDHQLCNASRCVTTEVLHLFRCSTHTPRSSEAF